MKTTFASTGDERDYLSTVQAELDNAQSKSEVIEVWKRHYLRIGHRKLGRLLLGRSPEEIVKARE